ncbi:hypothetical protein FHG87_015341 [Trinorchestia longiramus]|nr:hypothetical protein FHG87_015341 [Trinorchestia longiramus]
MSNPRDVEKAQNKTTTAVVMNASAASMIASCRTGRHHIHQITPAAISNLKHTRIFKCNPSIVSSSHVYSLLISVCEVHAHGSLTSHLPAKGYKNGYKSTWSAHHSTFRAFLNRRPDDAANQFLNSIKPITSKAKLSTVNIFYINSREQKITKTLSRRSALHLNSSEHHNLSSDDDSGKSCVILYDEMKTSALNPSLFATAFTGEVLCTDSATSHPHERGKNPFNSFGF